MVRWVILEQRSGEKPRQMAAIVSAPRSGKCLAAAAISLGRPPALWQRQLCSGRIGRAAVPFAQPRVLFQVTLPCRLDSASN